MTNCYEFCGALGWQIQQIGDSGGDQRKVMYQYDICGKLERMLWPYIPGQALAMMGEYVEYSDYDGLGRPRTIRNHGGGCCNDIVKYKYVGNRVAEKEYPQSIVANTVRQTFWSEDENNYDGFGRLDRVHTVSDPLAGTPNELVDLQYQFDDGGNVTARYDVLQNSGSTKWSQKYAYNNLSQLASALEGEMTSFSTTPTISSPERRWVWDEEYDSVTYSLDALGNWDKFYNNGAADDRTHNSVNELTSRTAGGTLSYDDNGNMVDNGTSYKCIYDYRNRLIEVTRQDDTSIAKYYYDGENRRIRKTVYDTDGSTELSDTRYIYNGGWQVIEERDYDSSGLEARYVYGGLYIDEPVVMYRDGNSDEDFADTDEVLYYLQDRLYNVVALTDATGTIRESVYYEPYGRSTCRDTTPSEQVESHFGNPYLFTGRRLDDKTCLYQYRNRYYSAALGRFISRDPIGYDAGDVNLYRYVGNRPITKMDSLGLKSKPIDISIRNFGVGTTGHWKGKFIWSCVEGKEDSKIDNAPGFTGWAGSVVIGGGIKIGGVGIGIGFFMTEHLSNNSAWEDCSYCDENGKYIKASYYHVDLTVTIKKHLSVIIGLQSVLAKRNLDLKCPCRVDKSKGDSGKEQKKSTTPEPQTPAPIEEPLEPVGPCNKPKPNDRNDGGWYPVEPNENDRNDGGWYPVCPEK